MNSQLRFGKLFGTDRARRNSACRDNNAKRLRFEGLEDRALLSVSPADFAEISDASAALVAEDAGDDFASIEISGALAKATEAKSTVVTTASDVVNANDGVVSLREAISYAASGATITFDASVFAADQTITLNGSELEIAKNVKINGAVGSKTMTLDANGESRVLSVAAGATVQLSNLTLTNGDSDADGGDGGAIYNAGKLTATKIVVSESCAANGGAIYNAGTLTLNDSTLADNEAQYGFGLGGAIYNADGATVDATNATISGNKAKFLGGGVYNAENATFETTNATISGNTAQSGGGIQNIGTFTATNLVVSGNAAKGLSGSFGGGVENSGTFTATNATIAGNSATKYGGGVVANSGATTLKNSIVAQNYAAQDADVYLYSAAATANASNVLSTFAAWTTKENAIAYSASKPLFVVAPTFDANGKLTNAATLNLRLVENSPAIDAGKNAYVSGVATDVAGNARIQGTAVDLGAYETSSVDRLATPTITSTSVGKSGVLVKWNKVSNAAGYEVRAIAVKTGETATFSVAAGKTQSLLTGLLSATEYSISVKAIGSGEYADSEFSAAVKATTWKKLATPKITSTEVATGVLVKWGKVYGAAGYTVTCTPVDASDAKTVSITCDASKAQVLFNILRPETKYSITVKANPADDAATTAPSDVSAAVVVTTNPMAAPKLTGGSPHAGSKGILLKWNSVGGATGYQIETREAGSNGDYSVTTVDAAAGMIQTVILTDIPRVAQYEIRVKALGLDGVYVDSPYTEATLDAKVLTTPKLTKISVRANGDLLVNWQKVYGAASYTIEYKLDGASEYTAITGITNKAGNKTLTGLVPGATYTIRVKAVGSGSYLDSTYSNQLNATTASGAKSTAFVALDSVFADSADDEDDEFWTI